ncbi:MAG TPA: farnesyl diphosphate synthase [Thermoanaerobaculia bacterium]|nr:farnesyl diphosphate synthase [Thermoanaerobaculia bacterium]
MNQPASFPHYLQKRLPAIESALERVLPPPQAPPALLHQAMRYSVFAGGKRVRPALLLLAGETFGADASTLGEPAAALELIHTFSLIHDDLPALDDDDLRRGRPTLHKQYDEALAILAGDALLDLGLEVLARFPVDLAAERRLRNVVVVAQAVGSHGMIGGQVADLEAERTWPDDPAATLASIHQRKTGALLRAALVAGGVCAGAGEPELALLERLGDQVGMLFQIRDDILDIEGTSESLGKTAGKDQAADKLTYPRVYGLDGARQRLLETSLAAREAAARLPGGGTAFLSLVDFLVQRQS